MTIVLQETLRAAFYAPLYAALALGAYEDEGVSVSFRTPARPSEAALGILDGSVHVTWGGPLRVIKTRQEVPGCDLVCFGEIVTRDPFLLVGGSPNPTFRLPDLASVTLATVSEVPTPWICLQDDIRQSGLEPESIRRITDQSMAANVDLLRRGNVEVIQVFEPFADELVAEGIGHIWYAAANRGQTSYTSFYARRDVMTEHREEFYRIVRALYRTQKWLHLASPSEISHVIASYFPTVPLPRLTRTIGRYSELGIWGRNPILPRVGYRRLQRAILSARFVDSTADYEDAVDNSLAEAAVRVDPPPLSFA